MFVFKDTTMTHKKVITFDCDNTFPFNFFFQTHAYLDCRAYRFYFFGTWLPGMRTLHIWKEVCKKIFFLSDKLYYKLI